MTAKTALALWFVSIAILNLVAGNILLGMMVLTLTSFAFFIGADLMLAARIIARRLADPRPRRVGGFALFGRMMFRD